MTEGERARQRPSTGKAPAATSEGEKKRSREEEIDWTLTKAEKERINEDVWKRVQGGRLTRASHQSTEGEDLPRAARKRTKVEVAANVYEALAEGVDEPMEMYKPAVGLYTCATDKWNRARIERENNERQLRNEIRRIAREERDRRISARIEQKRAE